MMLRWLKRLRVRYSLVNWLFYPCRLPGNDHYWIEMVTPHNHRIRKCAMCTKTESMETDEERVERIWKEVMDDLLRPLGEVRPEDIRVEKRYEYTYHIKYPLKQIKADLTVDVPEDDDAQLARNNLSRQAMLRRALGGEKMKKKIPSLDEADPGDSRFLVNSMGRCTRCGYEGPGPRHDCKPIHSLKLTREEIKLWKVAGFVIPDRLNPDKP